MGLEEESGQKTDLRIVTRCEQWSIMVNSSQLFRDFTAEGPGQVANSRKKSSVAAGSHRKQSGVSGCMVLLNKIESRICLGR